VTPTSRRPRLNAPRSGNYVPAAEGCPALAGLSVRPVTRVGPAFARLGPGASTAATRSSGAGGFPRDLVRDGWQAAGSSSRRCSAGCPPVPDAAAGGYADGGIRAGRRRRQEDGRDGQGSRRPGARQQHVHHPARHAPGPPRPHHPACPPPRPEDRPLPAMPPPRQPPPAARAGQNPLIQQPLDAPGVVAYGEHRCSFAPARGPPRGFGKRSRGGPPRNRHAHGVLAHHSP
jgi:hypothetical protein